MTVLSPVPFAGDAGGARLGGTGQEVRLQNLSKAFGDRVVLRRLDLVFTAGEIVAVVGRSGGGKTTLLRLIAGLEVPTTGTVSIGAQAVSGLHPAVRLLFQEPRLLPWQRVINNVGIARGDRWRKSAHDALVRVGLGDRTLDWPAVLSGGQKQRVSLARALVSHPAVLLLDEPFGALDALTRTEMHRLLTDVWREIGFTGVLITHDVAEAVALADRVLVLRDGEVAFDERVDLPRPRPEYGDKTAGALKARILREV